MDYATSGRIVAALAQAGIDNPAVRVVRVSQGPQVSLWQVAIPPADFDRALRQGRAIAAGVDSRGGVTVRQVGQVLEVGVPTARPEVVHLGELGPFIGLTPDGRKVPLTLDRGRPHCVIGSMTRKGKSKLLQVVAIIQARRPRTRLGLIDLKPSDVWDPFEGTGHLIARSADEATALLAWAASHIGAGGDERIVILIDEVSLLGRQGKALAVQIAERGGADQVHLVAATQYPSDESLPRRVAVNCDWRIAFRCADYNASTVVLDQVGAEKLTGEPGDGLIVRSGADAVRFQAALPEEDDWSRIRTVEPLTLGCPTAAPEPVHGGRVPRGDYDRMVAWAIANAPAGSDVASGPAIRQAFGCGSSQATRVQVLAREQLASPPPRLTSAPLLRPNFGRVGAPVQEVSR